MFNIFFHGPKTKKVTPTFVSFSDPDYVMEFGPRRVPMIITKKELHEGGVDFNTRLRQLKLRADYVLGAWDASIPPRRIEVDEEFHATFWNDKSTFEWKLYRTDGKIFKLVETFASPQAEAIDKALSRIKKDMKNA